MKSVSAKKRASKNGDASFAVEWVGGIRSVPGMIIEEGAPYAPEILMWAVPDEPIVGFALQKPGEALRDAAAHLRETLEKTRFERTIPRPTRVRVADPDLAAALRSEMSNALEILCDATPELDAAMAGLAAFLDASRATRAEVIDGADPDRIAASYRAAANLYRAKPWKLLDSDEDVLSVSSEALGLNDAALSVMGALGQSCGFLLFASFADFERFYEFAVSSSHGDPATTLPPHLALSFDRKADVELSIRKEVAAHGWELANASAYPSFVRNDGSLRMVPPAVAERRQLDALALGLSLLPATREGRGALREAFTGGEPFARTATGGEPFARTVRVETFEGPVDLTFRAPHPADEHAMDQDQDVRALVPPDELLIALKRAEGLGNRDERQAEIEELSGLLFVVFDASAEGQGAPRVDACAILCQWLAESNELSIASLAPEHVDELLFEVLPRTSDLDPSGAKDFVEELRGFLRFLAREYRFAAADACLAELNPDTVRDLARELGDARNFGPAKTILTAGKRLGFDVSSPLGVGALMKQVERVGFPALLTAAGLQSPAMVAATSTSTSTAQREAAKAKAKAKRKAARTQRKKGR